MSRNKGGGRYANIKRVMIDGHTFHSGREAKRYTELKLLLKAGQISDLKLQPRFKLGLECPDCGVKHPILLKSKRYPNGRVLTYVADFQYLDEISEEIIIEDVKMQSGHTQPEYRIKRAIMDAMGLRITEY